MMLVQAVKILLSPGRKHKLSVVKISCGNHVQVVAKMEKESHEPLFKKNILSIH